MRRDSSAGFTLVEVLIALVMLSAIVLSLAAGTTKYLSIITRNRIRIQAASVADARVASVRVHPDYATLVAQFDGTQAGIPFPGYSRVTRVVRTGANTAADRTNVVVTVTGPQLPTAVVRYATIAAP